MSTKRLLISMAHPDDESFGSGGLIAKYVAAGVEVSYIVATKGDRGTIDQEYLDQYGSVEAVRDAEMDCASAVLGFKNVYKFGYRDSGMQGSPENDDPASLIQADREQVTAHIVKIIRALKPHVVLTFDEYGGYGHPDHIFMHDCTTAAFHAAGDATQYPDAGEPFAPQKLYYTVISSFLVKIGIWNMRLRLKNPRQLGRNKDIDLLEVLAHVPSAHTIIDVADYMDAWEQANQCHASQGGGSSMVPRWLRTIMARRQKLHRAYPPVSDTTHTMENDIFHDVK